MPRPFFWKLFLGHALLTAAVVIVSVFLIAREVERNHLRDLTDQLLRKAELVAEAVAPRLHRDDPLQDEIRRLSRHDPDLRVTFIAPDGRVLADSHADPATMESHADRPEFRDALSAGRGESTRYSHTIHRDLKYLALRLGPAQDPRAVVRVALPIVGIAAHAEATRRLAGMIAGTTLLAALALALGLARIWSNPLRRIADTARSLSRGDLRARADPRGSDELADLARALNQMRDALAAQLLTIDRQRQNLEALIRALTEGVIAAGPDGRIVLANPAAVRLLRALAPAPPPAARNETRTIRDRSNNETRSVSERSNNETRTIRDRSNNETRSVSERRHDAVSPHVEGERFSTDKRESPPRPDPPTLPDLLVGRAVDDCITHPDLARLLAPTPVGPDAEPTAPREIRIQSDTPAGVVSVLARVSQLHPSAPGDAPAPARVVVLTDVTELARTLQMRSDFVANASHELRTPLAAIRASVETLLQMDRAPDAARGFLAVIDRHSARLESLVREMLDLSRLESPHARFPAQPLHLPDLLVDLRARFAHALETRRLDWSAECPPQCHRLVANPFLLDLVLDNLVDNAIKFTDAGRVSVLCRGAGNGDIEIAVRDDGCGIPPEEQSRVFERFFQVRRARSDAPTHTRGAGLGLSIARHAASLLNARLSLDSAPARGTTVTLRLPQNG